MQSPDPVAIAAVHAIRTGDTTSLARISTQLIRSCSRMVSPVVRGMSGQVSWFALARSHALPLL